MNKYQFTLVLGDATSDTMDLEDRLYEAGCDDALMCSYNQTVYLEFDRLAGNVARAILSARNDIQRAGFRVASIQEGGYASMAEMAERAGLSRAALNNYAKGTRGDGDFPAPVYGIASSSPLFSWPEVATWLHSKKKLAATAFEVASVATKVQANHINRHSPVMDSRIAH